MTILTELQSAQRHAGVQGCGWERWIATLPEWAQSEWETALLDASFTTASIWRVAKAHGYRLSDNTVTVHRRNHLK